MAKKTVRELSGLDVGKVATISPNPGFTITDEIRSVVHGYPNGGMVEQDASVVWVRFKSVLPAHAFEMGERGNGFRFDPSDVVEVSL